MIRVYVKKQSNYPVSTPGLKKRLVKFFEDQGIVSDADVTVAIVGESSMRSLAKKYLNEEKGLHNVLSFPNMETRGEFIDPPDDKIHLGEIVICYPVVFREVTAKGRLLNDRVYELAEHGALHLLGKHHE